MTKTPYEEFHHHIHCCKHYAVNHEPYDPAYLEAEMDSMTRAVRQCAELYQNQIEWERRQTAEIIGTIEQETEK